MKNKLIVKKMFEKWKYLVFNKCYICNSLINNNIYTTI